MKIRYCLIAVCLLLAAWSAPVYAKTVGAATPKPDRRLWQLAALQEAQFEQQGIVLHDAALTTYLNQVVERLWQQAGSSLSPLNIETIVDPRPQAFAYPNGYSVVTTGMLAQIENEDQLAVIIAHEMVHYLRQHTLALYDYYHRPDSLGSFRDSNRAQFSSNENLAKKIDAAEYQADQEGLSILTKAGYCGSQAPALIANLMNQLPDQATPDAVKRLKERSTRITAMLKQIRADSACVPASAGDHPTYLNRIAPALLANTQAALAKGDWQQADASLALLQETAPADARVYYLKGEILRRRDGSHGQTGCIGYYVKALEIDPGFPSAQRALGEVYYKAGRYQEARPYFEAFLSLAPQDDAREYIKGYLKQCQQ